MSGSSRSMFIMAGINIRVAAAPTYYPAHNKNGVNVDQRIVVRAVGNIPSKANQGKGEVVGLNLVAWGKLADVLARSMSKGKEFSVEMAPHTYKGQVYFKNPMDPNAPIVAVTINTPQGVQKVMVEKTSFRIKKIIFGEESNETIRREEAAGTRPAGWNVAGSPGHAAWLAVLKARNEEQYTPGKKTFGHAEVREISGPGIAPYDHTKTRANATTTAQAIANAIAGATAMPAPPTAVVAPAPAAPSTAIVAGL